MTFEVGEIIERLEPGPDITQGKQYSVIGIDGTSDPILFNDSGIKRSYDKSKFYSIRKRSIMLDSFKKYYDKHQDVIFTAAIVLLVDQFVLGGALRNRIKGIAEKMLCGLEKKVDGSTSQTGV